MAAGPRGSSFFLRRGLKGLAEDGALQLRSRQGRGVLARVSQPSALNLAAPAEAHAQYSRRTPIVEAVQKTRNGLVKIKIEKTRLADARSTPALV